MSEVFELPVSGGDREYCADDVFQAGGNGEWCSTFCTDEQAQHAAHAINHVDALADALEIMLSENSTMSKWLSDNYWDAEESENLKKAKKALAAYRGGK